VFLIFEQGFLSDLGEQLKREMAWKSPRFATL
jgi:hypothetical protein